MSLRIDNGERATLEYADIALSPTRYIASWLRQRGWRLPDYRCLSLRRAQTQPHVWNPKMQRWKAISLVKD